MSNSDQDDLPETTSTEEHLMGREAHIAKLRAGKRTSFRGKGNSMVPRIKSGQRCTYDPVLSHDDVKKNDMVYCHVGKYYFTHLVTGIRGDGSERRYQISNNSGHVNGWIPLERIFGKVLTVDD